jgi:hypothetical protein
MQNTITCNNITFTATKANKPFSNNFVQLDSAIVQYKGKDEIFATVQCTKDSREEGRIYACTFSMKGKLLGCYTIN